MPFIVSYEGREYSTDDLTLDEMELLERALGSTWYEINPMQSARHCRAVVALFLAQTHSEDEAGKLAAAIPVRQATRMVRWEKTSDLPDVYEDGIPKAEADPSTTGSSGTPEPLGSGPLT